MTIISSGVDYSLTATRLASLRDVMALKRVQRAPIVKLTATGPAGDQQQQTTTKQQKQQQQAAAQKGASSSSSGQGGDGGGGGGGVTAAGGGSSTAADSTDKDMSLLRRFKRIIDEKKDNYEQEKRRKAQQLGSSPSSTSEASSGTMAEMILGLLTPSGAPATAGADTTTTAGTAQAATGRTAKLSPAAPIDDGKSDASVVVSYTATSEAVDLRRGKTTSPAEDNGGSALRRRTPSSAAIRDSGDEKSTAQKSTAKNKSKQSSETDAGTTVWLILVMSKSNCFASHATQRTAISLLTILPRITCLIALHIIHSMRMIRPSIR